MRRRFLALPLLLLVALPLSGSVAGCGATPTLPLPPPVASVSESKNGLVLVEGEVLPEAYVSVFNARTDAGVITRADEEGLFAAEIEAVIGDRLSIWQERDGEVGERRELIVPTPR